MRKNVYSRVNLESLPSTEPIRRQNPQPTPEKPCQQCQSLSSTPILTQKHINPTYSTTSKLTTCIKPKQPANKTVGYLNQSR